MNGDTGGPGEARGDARQRRGGRLAKPAGLLAAGAVAGGILAASFSASAATSSPTTGATSSTTQGSSGYSATAPAPQGAPGGRGPVGGSAPVRSDEQALSATDAAKVKAAALAAVKGGTVYRVETDAGDGAYEAHMAKADGTLVTVKLDKSFKVIAVEDGMGKGDPAPAGQPGQSSSSSQSGSTTNG
jgi:hypothetical protein